MKSTGKAETNAGRSINRKKLFATCFGLFLGLSLLKFGNPPIMEKWVTPPQGAYEFFLGSPWPISWAYGILGCVTLIGVSVSIWKADGPKWLLLVPAGWLAWQFLGSLHTVSPELTHHTLLHFAATVVCFYLGFFALANVRDLRGFWFCVLIPFLIVLGVGWAQKFG